MVAKRVTPEQMRERERVRRSHKDISYTDRRGRMWEAIAAGRPYDEVAAYWGVSRDRVRDEVWKENMRRRYSGRTWLERRATARFYLDANLVQPPLTQAELDAASARKGDEPDWESDEHTPGDE